MCQPPKRTPIRLAVAATPIFVVAAAAAVAPIPRAAAAPTSEAPGEITWGPGCPNPNPNTTILGDPTTQWAAWDTHLTWSDSGGDYIGPDGDRFDGLYLGNCNGSTRHILDPPDGSTSAASALPTISR
jgi:hypothetical protein